MTNLANKIEIRSIIKNSIEQNLAFVCSISELEQRLNANKIQQGGNQNVILMEMMDGLSVGLNFDMGNSSYWGFDPDNEIPKIGPWIKNVHIKDCTPEAYTLPLGKGNVDFDKVFSLLKSQNYNGLFILQAAPAKNGDEKKISKQYLDFSQKFIY